MLLREQTYFTPLSVYFIRQLLWSLRNDSSLSRYFFVILTHLILSDSVIVVTIVFAFEWDIFYKRFTLARILQSKIWNCFILYLQLMFVCLDTLELHCTSLFSFQYRKMETEPLASCLSRGTPKVYFVCNLIVFFCVPHFDFIFTDSIPFMRKEHKWLLLEIIFYTIMRTN